MPPPLHCVGPVCVFSHAGLRWISCLVCTSAWSVWPGFMLCCFWSGCVVSHFFRKRGRAPACCGGLGCVALMGWVALFSVALFSHQKQAERTYFSVQLVEPTGVTQEGVTQQYTKYWGSRGGSKERGEVGSFCLGPSVFRTLIWYSDFLERGRGRANIQGQYARPTCKGPKTCH